METNATSLEPSFEEVIAALLDSNTPFHPRFLYCLSDLYGIKLAQFKEAWTQIPAWRRQAILEDMESFYEADTLLSFESVCRLALDDDNTHTRFLALRSLLNYKTEDLIPVFSQIVDKDPDEELRALAALSLGQYVYLGEIEELPQKVLADLQDRLIKIVQGDAPTLVRRRALESLGYANRKEVPGLIETANNSGDENWITSALLAMGRSCDRRRWEPVVLQMLSHGSDQIRFEAARAAGELESARAKPLLMALLEEEDLEVRMAAVWSLSQIGGHDLQLLFEDLLEEAESDEEVELIEDALDNLIFNESIDLYDSLDFEDAED